MQIREWNDRYAEIAKRYDSLYHKVAAQYGFSDVQHWILYVLFSEEDRVHTQNGFAKEFGLPKQTLHSAMAKLRDAGYIALSQMPGPRNNKAITLTEEGRACCVRCVEPLLRAENRALERITEEENARFLRLFEKRYEIFREEIRELLEEKP